eukprot:6273969-Amphidinium_carterae.1
MKTRVSESENLPPPLPNPKYFWYHVSDIICFWRPWGGSRSSVSQSLTQLSVWNGGFDRGHVLVGLSGCLPGKTWTSPMVRGQSLISTWNQVGCQRGIENERRAVAVGVPC